MEHSIKLTQHASLKLRLLEAHGFTIDERKVTEAVSKPDKVDPGYKPGRSIAQKSLDDTHVLRLVLKE